MKISILIIGTLFSSFHVFSQDNKHDAAVLEAIAVLRSPKASGMNAMPVTPLLTDKISIESPKHDAFKLPGGMICLTPDSSALLKLRVVEPLGSPMPVKK